MIVHRLRGGVTVSGVGLMGMTGLVLRGRVSPTEGEGELDPGLMGGEGDGPWAIGRCGPEAPPRWWLINPDPVVTGGRELVVLLDGEGGCWGAAAPVKDGGGGAKGAGPLGAAPPLCMAAAAAACL